MSAQHSIVRALSHLLIAMVKVMGPKVEATVTSAQTKLPKDICTRAFGWPQRLGAAGDESSIAAGWGKESPFPALRA